MKGYELKIDIKRLLHYSGISKSQISNKTLLMTIKSFSSYIRDLYLLMIEEEIYSRRYKGKWEPVDDEEYIDYLGTTPSTHIILLIKDALEIREINNDIIIRVDPEYKYPDSRLPLIKVLRAIDNGTSKFNARPLIRHVIRRLNSEIPKLWRNYLKKKGVI